MAEAIKHTFNPTVVKAIAKRVHAAYPAFERSAFERSVNADLETLSLLARSQRIALGLREHLPRAFPEALDILLRALGESPSDVTGMGRFVDLPFVNFVGTFGVEHPQASLPALEEMTKHFSAEWDIRPFLIHHEALALEQLHRWASHSDWRVRRLATEGSRPRLPWGVRLVRFVKDPTLTLAVLERLKGDPHANVRNSVANHLNDIAKDHPDVALDVAQRWSVATDAGTRRIIRHALRSLIKRGNPRALALLGHHIDADIRLSGFKLVPRHVSVGEVIRFSFMLTLRSKSPASVVVDYRVHHRKARGKESPKVFKLTTRKLLPGEGVQLAKIHKLTVLTTRRYHPGKHRLEILVNGKALGETSFELAV